MFVMMLTCLALASTSWSANYYVDKNNSSASDSNPGTEISPWKTIQKGANVAIAGDTVYVKNGTYFEWVIIKNSGTSGKPVTFKAYPGDHPVVNGTGVKLSTGGGLFYAEGKDYIVIDGFELTISNQYLLRLTECDYLEVKNCTIHDNESSGVSAVLIQYSNHGLFTNNEVYKGGRNAISVTSSNHMTVSYNYVHDNPAHNGVNIFPVTADAQTEYSGNNIIGNILTGATSGIYCRYQKDNEIYNNVIYGNNASGIRLEPDQLDPHNFQANTKIYNNTIVDNNTNGIRSANASHLTIKNNIIAYNGNYDIYIASGVTNGHDIDYNLYYSSPNFGWGGSISSSLSSWQAVSGQDSNAAEANPNFSGRSSSDYTLTAASTMAIDQGLDLSYAGTTKDISGISRPQGNGVDIGAYEYPNGDLSYLYPPTNLHVQ